MSLFDDYFNYAAHTEPPLIYHRWSLIAAIAAFLGRRFWLPFGSWRIYPNQYIMLVGNPGTRKSTAVKMASDVIAEVGYRNFSANKTRLEKFLLDLEGEILGDLEEKGKKSNIVLTNLFGADDADCVGLDPREIFILAPEFNVFMPRGDLDFLGLLGDLWDWDNEKRKWTYRLKNSKSVHIFQPTISILSGNTHAGIQEVFPPQAIGQGFLSRLIMVYAEPSGRKITFPETPAESLHKKLLQTFLEIGEKVAGAATITKDGKRALDVIYRSWIDIEDQRFKHYSTRRFTHLLKLALVCAAARVSTEIGIEDVILASSLLSFTEASMPKALGEFGKSKNSEAANKIMQILYEARKPLKMEALWKVVQNDLEKIMDLSNILNNLQSADKIQIVKGEGFLPKQKPLDRKLLYTDYNILKEFKNGS